MEQKPSAKRENPELNKLIEAAIEEYATTNQLGTLRNQAAAMIMGAVGNIEASEDRIRRRYVSDPTRFENERSTRMQTYRAYFRGIKEETATKIIECLIKG